MFDSGNGMTDRLLFTIGARRKGQAYSGRSQLWQRAQPVPSGLSRVRHFREGVCVALGGQEDSNSAQRCTRHATANSARRRATRLLVGKCSRSRRLLTIGCVTEFLAYVRSWNRSVIQSSLSLIPMSIQNAAKDDGGCLLSLLSAEWRFTKTAQTPRADTHSICTRAITDPENTVVACHAFSSSTVATT